MTGASCTCEGFVYSQECMHHAALLDRLGWLLAVVPLPIDRPRPAA